MNSNNLFYCMYYQAVAKHLAGNLSYRLSCYKYWRCINSEFYPANSKLLRQAAFNDMISHMQ